MRDIVGLLLLNVGFLVAGAAVIAGLRLTRTAVGLLRAAGLALIVGWAATGTLLSLGLAVGIPLSIAFVVGLWALLVAAAALPLRVTGAWHAPATARVAEGRELAVLWLGRAAVLLGVVATAARSWYPDGRLHPDVWNVWLPKAKIIDFTGTLTTSPGGFTSQISPDYPPLHTGLEATAFRFMGGAHVLRLPLESWMVSVAFLLAIVWLLRLWCPQHVAWLGAGLTALMPSYTRLVGSGLADDPLATLFALAGLTAALWLLTRDSRLLALSALFAAAATMTKNEGTMLVLVMALSLALAMRGVSRAVGFLSASIVCVLAWRTWQHVNHVPRNFAYDFTKIADPSYLVHRTYRFAYGAAQVSKALASPSHWLLVPLALIVLSAAAAGARELRVFVASAFLLALLGYIVIYWISPVPLHAYIDSSATRVVDTIALFSAAVLPLLAVGVRRVQGTTTTPSASA
jgi:hypothetical protein